MNNYMGKEFLHTCGIGVSVLNVLLVLLLVYVFIREFMRLLSKENKDNREFHFIMILTVIAFGLANNMAYQRFYEAWVKAEVKNIQTSLIINAIIDRTAMGFTGVGLYFLSKRKKPSWFQGKYEDDD